MKYFLAASFLVLSGCASIFNGSYQEIAVNTDPEGATCELTRYDEKLGTLTTPGSINVEKTKDMVKIVCRKDGYYVASRLLEAETQVWTYANAMLGLGYGLLGRGIDSVAGADNSYKSPVNITLTKWY